MPNDSSIDGYRFDKQERLPPEDVVFGRSEAMQILRQKVEKVAGADVPVLIQGESGTGKEVLAKFIHFRSPRRNAPFVKVTCPAIPGTLLESELFGYEKGAFTGAYVTKPGRAEWGHRGTLFLDEISEIDLTLQAKLLQLLQDGRFCRIGAKEDRRVDVRVICATNCELEERVEGGLFREDLFYRINVVSLRMPPLRARTADIPILVNYLLACYNQTFNGRAQPLSPSLLRQFQEYDWPGNIRQLENLIKRYVILGSEECISSELRSRNKRRMVPEIPADGSVSLKNVARQAMREFERKIIFEALEANHWNRKETARALNISYRALLYKLRRVGRPATGEYKMGRSPSGPAASSD